MSPETHRCRVVFLCARRHSHELCVEMPRGVPPELRCEREANSGVSYGGGGCPLPESFEEVAAFTLRQDLERWKSKGYVEVSF